MLGAGDVPGELDRGLGGRIRPVVALVERDRFDDALRHRLFGLQVAERVVAKEQRLFWCERACAELSHVSCCVPEWTVGGTDVGLRLDKYLAAPDRAGSRPKAAAALERGKVFVNDREMTLADAARASPRATSCGCGPIGPAAPSAASTLGADRDLPVVYEDDALIVLNKPAGLLAVPLPLQRRNDARSVFEDLKIYLRQRGRRRPFVVHRIDRDTSGLVLFAKSEGAQLALKEQFKRRHPERVYQAVVYGLPSPASGTWHDHLVWDLKALIQKETSPRDPRGKEAISHYRVLEPLTGASLIEVAWSPASATRSGFRRGCADTRWSARCATSTGPTAAPDRVSASGAARAPPDLQPPVGRTRDGVRGRRCPTTWRR